MLRPLVLGRILRDINPDIIHSHLCVPDTFFAALSFHLHPQMQQYLFHYEIPVYHARQSIPALVSKEVSRYTKISNLITFMELSQGAGKWADRLLEYNQEFPDSGPFSESHSGRLRLPPAIKSCLDVS